MKRAALYIIGFFGICFLLGSISSKADYSIIKNYMENLVVESGQENFNNANNTEISSSESIMKVIKYKDIGMNVLVLIIGTMMFWTYKKNEKNTFMIQLKK